MDNIETSCAKVCSSRNKLSKPAAKSQSRCKSILILCVLIIIFNYFLYHIASEQTINYTQLQMSQLAYDFNKINEFQTQWGNILEDEQKIQRRLLQKQEETFNKNIPLGSNTSQLKQAKPGDSSNSTNTQVYVILLILGLALLVVGALIVLAVVIYRNFISPEEYPQNSRSNRVGNVSKMQLDIGMIAPPLKYQIFVKQIGQPLHDNCVICLQSFQNELFKNPVQEENISSLVEPGNQIKNEAINDNKSWRDLVCLTVCGHLLHQRCLKQWIAREPNCPLCRQEFSDQNLTQWQNKIGIDFAYLHCTFKKQKKQERPAANSMLSNNKNKIANINLIYRQQNISYGNLNERDYANNFSRDSIQLHWLRIYNNRKIINKERHQKYNIYSIVKKISKVKKYNNYKLCHISNQVNRQLVRSCAGDRNKIVGSEQQNSSNIINKLSLNQSVQNNKQEYQHNQLYALMIYSAIMDYHQARIQNSPAPKKQESATSHKQNPISKIDTQYNDRSSSQSSSSEQETLRDISNINKQKTKHNRTKNGRNLLHSSQSENNTKIPNNFSKQNSNNKLGTSPSKSTQTINQKRNLSKPFVQQLQNLQNTIYPNSNNQNHS